MSGVATHCKYSTWRIFVHTTDAFWLSLIVIAQGFILNYYILSHYKNSITPYFLFAADLVCLITFILTLIASFSHLKKIYACKDVEDGFGRFFRLQLITSKLGAMPLSYISWLFYTVILVTKIVVIFQSGIVDGLNTQNHFGPQLLKVTIASSSFIFLLLAEGHNWVKRGLPRNAYVTTVCAKTGIEIFDSVSLLSILIGSEGPQNLSSEFKDLVLALAAINFFLPTVKLYQLSFRDLSDTKLVRAVTVIYMLAHIVLIDVPFLSVRLYLWLAYREDASMFIMKNILGIILTLRGMYPELISFRKGFFTNDKQSQGDEEINMVQKNIDEDIKPKVINSVASFAHENSENSEEDSHRPHPDGIVVHYSVQS